MISSSYHYQSNGWVVACIKFVKCTFKKCFESRSDPSSSSIADKNDTLGQGLPSPATLLFNCPIRGIMPVVNRLPIGSNNDEKHHNALINRQGRHDKDDDTSKIFNPFIVGFTVVVQHEDGGLWTHGTIEEKGNHNYHNRSYKICIATTEKQLHPTGNT